MSWHFSVGQEEVCWPRKSLDGAPSALLSLIPTPVASSSPAKERATSTTSPSGTTSAASMADLGEDIFRSFLVVSRAKTSLSLAKERGLKARNQDYGPRWRESLTRWNPNTSSWRTHQCSLFGGLAPFSLIWPRWGMMHDGECWALDTLVLPTEEIESGLSRETWVTPTARDWKDTPGMSKDRPGRRNRIDQLARQVYHREQTPKGGGLLHPAFPEWLLQWPIGWTDCEPLATDRYQQWRRSHGKP